jgi:hypothetical protein
MVWHSFRENDGVPVLLVQVGSYGYRTRNYNKVPPVTVGVLFCRKSRPVSVDGSDSSYYGSCLEIRVFKYGPCFTFYRSPMSCTCRTSFLQCGHLKRKRHGLFTTIHTKSSSRTHHSSQFPLGLLRHRFLIMGVVESCNSALSPQRLCGNTSIAICRREVTALASVLQGSNDSLLATFAAVGEVTRAKSERPPLCRCCR